MVLLKLDLFKNYQGCPANAPPNLEAAIYDERKYFRHGG